MTGSIRYRIAAFSGNRFGLLLLFLIIAIAAYLRLHMLGVRSLWATECFSVLVARQPWPTFLRTMWWGEGNMALYYTLLRGWQVLGDSEVWLQSLSVLFGVLTILVLYALGSRFLSQKVGLISAALLAVHGFHIEHSEQLRSYSLLTLLVVLSTYLFLALLDSPQKKYLWMFYVLFSALAIYAQVFAVFVLAAQWFALKRGRIKQLGSFNVLFTFIAILVLVTPLLAVMTLRDHGQLDWVPGLSFQGILNVIWGIVGADVLGLQYPRGKVLLAVLYLACWILALWGILRKDKDLASVNQPNARTAVAVLACSLFFPILAMAAISLVKPILYPRYVLMCVPAAVMLASQGIVTIERWFWTSGKLISYAILVAMIAMSLVGVRQFDVSLQNPGLDWRRVTKYILEHGEAGDAAFFYSLSGEWAWEYYSAREVRVGQQIPKAISLPSMEQASIETGTAPYRRVWLILHQEIATAQSDANGLLLRQTLEKRFRLADKKEFDGLSIFPGEDVSIHVALYSVASTNLP
jgi:uncharacterized membrane protein